MSAPEADDKAPTFPPPYHVDNYAPYPMETPHNWNPSEVGPSYVHPVYVTDISIQQFPSDVELISAQPEILNFRGAIIFACIVCWCFGGLFGGIAYFQAIDGQSDYSNGNNTAAKRKMRNSYILSTIGLVVGIVATISYFVFFLQWNQIRSSVTQKPGGYRYH